MAGYTLAGILNAAWWHCLYWRVREGRDTIIIIIMGHCGSLQGMIWWWILLDTIELRCVVFGLHCHTDWLFHVSNYTWCRVSEKTEIQETAREIVWLLIFLTEEEDSHASFDLGSQERDGFLGTNSLGVVSSGTAASILRSLVETGPVNTRWNDLSWDLFP